MVRRILGSSLFRGSVLVFIAGNIGNLGNFLYNIAMGRMLSPDIYGELEATLSMSSLLVVPVSILSIYIIKVVSTYWGAKKYSEVFNFISKQRSRLLKVGLVGSLLILFLSPLVLGFLRSSSYLPVIFLGIVFLLSGMTTVNNGGLQGTLAFKYLTLNGVLITLIKLAFSAVFVYLNFQLLGALLGPVLSIFAGFILSIFELRIIFNKNINKDPARQGFVADDAFFPSLFATLGLTVFFTADVILARHFLTPFEAGGYAAIATVGKIVYYGSGPIIAVMFPVISARVSSGSSYYLPLVGSFAASLGTGIVVVLFLSFYPNVVLEILFGHKYLSMAPFLAPYGFFTLIYSGCSLLTHFLLSVSSYRPMLPLFIISIFQGVLILIFHASISQIILVNIIIAFLYLITVSVFAVCRLNEKQKCAT